MKKFVIVLIGLALIGVFWLLRLVEHHKNSVAEEIPQVTENSVTNLPITESSSTKTLDTNQVSSGSGVVFSQFRVVEKK